MELDLGLRINREIENLTFSSTETETVFVLLAHLPGFKKDEIEISINEDGTKISISGGGERSSIETTIPRRLMLATEVIERFQKEFRIPNGVDLDRIDVGFDEENAILIVLMPKLIKGDVSGVEIEEIKEREDEEAGEEGKETSLEQDKQEGEEATSKEEEEEEKGEGKETPITEDEQEEKGADDEVLMKEKEQEVKGEGEEASFKEQQEKESLSERNHEETQEFHISYKPETDQNGEPEPEKEQIGMEQKIPREEIEEERGASVVPDQLPTPPVPVETHDLEEIEALGPPQEPQEDSNLRQTKTLDSAEKDREIANGIGGGGRERIGEEEGDASGMDSYHDLGLREEVGTVKREGNGNGSGKKGRKKGKAKGLSPVAPSLAFSAFIVSLAVLAFHFLRRRKK